MYTKKHQIMSSELNQKLQTKTISLINIIQDCESLHIDFLTKLSSELQKENAGVFLNYRQIQIYDRPKYCDILTVKTFPTITKGYFGYRNTIIYNEKNEVLVASKSFGAYIQVDTLKNIRLSEETLKSINNYDEDTNLLNFSRKIEIPNLNPIKKEEFKIYDYHMDKHQHLNNAYYIEFAEEVLEKDFHYNTIRVEHKQTVLAGDSLIPLLYNQKEIQTVVLLTKENNITAIIEFSKMGGN